ncbi:MAG TPA: hypothetical protein VJR50_17685 [Mycobacterium sp.]|nr:hypothetical protein [Mycobacterium sp.]
MSPQTFRTISNGGRKSTSAAGARGRVGTVLRHEMTVVGSSVADVVASTGGWLYDHRMAGWQVSVLVADRSGERSLRILGADVLDLSADLEAVTDDPECASTLAVAADLFAADRRVRQFVSASECSRAEVALWGDPARLGENVNAVSYRLSAAARAFKAQALTAAGFSGSPVEATEALYRRGVTVLPRVAARF